MPAEAPDPPRIPPPDPAAVADLVGVETVELRSAQGTVPLRLLHGPSGAYLLSGSPSGLWSSEVARSGEAVLRVGGPPRRYGAVPVRDEGERGSVLREARRQYGAAQFDRWFPRPGLLFRLGRPTSHTTPYPEWLASEFDRLAPSYAAQLSANPVEGYLRDRAIAHLLQEMRGHSRLLEVGGGVGLETIPLLQEGHEVTVVDVAPGMLEQLRAHARREGVAERLSTTVGLLGALEDREDLGVFDGAWSTFGALNCEADLRAVGRGLAARLHPGAPLILTTFNRWALLESAGLLLKFRWAPAFARLHRTLPVGSSRFSIDCFPYSTREVRRALAREFELRSEVGLLVLLPPPNWPLARRLGGAGLERLARWDAWVGAHWPGQALGDHELLSFTRRSTPAEGGR